MDEQDCHRQAIPEASAYVRLRREDVQAVVAMVEHIKAVSKKAWEDPAWYCRTIKALEDSCQDQ